MHTDKDLKQESGHTRLWTFRVFLFCLYLCLSVFICGHSGAAPAVAQTDQDRFRQGTEAFRFIIRDLDFSPLSSIQELTKDPERSVLVVLGETGILDEVNNEVSGGLRGFVERGGALLVATDRRVPATNRNRSALQQFGVRVFPQPVRMVAGDWANCYRGLGLCPIAQPAIGAKPPLFQNLPLGVATNRAGFLFLDPPGDQAQLRILAVFPEGCRPDHRDELHEERPLPFAAGRDWGMGRILVLADHSVFINDMMMRADNNNIDFADNCLRWLRDGGPKRRDRILFVEEGIIVTDFNVASLDMPFPPFTPPDDMVSIANRFLVGLGEESNDRILGEEPWEKNRTMGRILKALAVVLTLGLVLYGFVRLSRGRYRIEPGSPLLAPTLARLAPAGVLVEQRHEAMQRDGNFCEPARALAQQFFESVLGQPWRAPGVSPGMPLPGHQATGGWWRRRRLGKQLRHLWQVAFAAVGAQVSRQGFARVTAEIAELKAALARGTLRFGGGRT